VLPVTLDCADWPIVLVGAGPPALRRLAMLDAAGCREVTVFAPIDAALRDTALRDTALRDGGGPRYRPGMPGEQDVAGARLLFVAGLAPTEAAALAALARRHRVPVNVEDQRPDCDFHVPAIVRRGGLLLAVSTGGASPALAARLRRWLEGRFGPEWAGRLQRAEALRTELRAAGRASEVTEAVNALADEENWFIREA
jgi:precorrin-2 dehydrogenase/sirohydrochlorin ferrochelatase